MGRDIAKAKPPIELFQKGKDEACAWVCAGCHLAQGDRQHALECCAPWSCDSCGAVIERHSYCQPCHEKKEADREVVLLANAKKVPLAEYGCPYLSCPRCDEIFDSGDEHDVCPGIAWAWGCHEERLTLDAESILSSALEEHFEDACEYVDSDTLQVVLNAWVKEHGDKVITYFEDTSVVVLLPVLEAAEYSDGA